MRSPAAAAIPIQETTRADYRGVIGSLLFIALFLFVAISLNPFYDLTVLSSASITTDNSNKFNQLLFILLPFGALGCGLATPMRGTFLQPRWLLSLLFLWLVFVSLVSNHSFNSLKALFVTSLIVLGANAILLLPRSEKHFAKLLAVGTLACIGLAYYGIKFLPFYSIHSAADVAEPMHAGLWRGYFPHKNNAAAAMVLFSFCGIFIFRTWSRIVGLVILASATFFLMHTGGKTASAMLPAIILVGWVFEKIPFLRMPLSFLGVAALNLFAVGSSLNPSLSEIVTNMGIDATFTNRSDIWKLAFNAISEFPMTGFGLKSFWRTTEMVYGGQGLETWAIQASHAHNSYVEILLIGGIPALVLSLIWFFAVPLRSFAKITREGRKLTHTGRLFLRIWLYMIFTVCLESLFYESSAGYIIGWFLFCMALFGIRYEANAAHMEEPASPKREIARA
ncbi:O-antigen ligase family protein [Rhizobium sp. XQZ8]|uniref:O-antigen ligase family protein n=1 Tax=Rhizobium populisoli TaxID=2859785 RepID=UPI001C6734FA|nr:O-antigen ligase [Rhizobium populisoli]MBW6421943.1 O-antigen ligase family protein [Rhizobium populisoli]